MITQVLLSRFKKFNDNSIRLRPFTILMGENSSGKTTILQAINLAMCTFTAGKLITVKNGTAVIRKGVGASHLPGISIVDFRELYYTKVTRETRAGAGTPAVIQLEDEWDNKYKLQISSAFGTYNMKCISTPEELAKHPELHLFSPLFISGFVGLEEAEQRLFPVNIREHLATGHASEIIRNIVLGLKKGNPDGYKSMSERLICDFGFYLSNVDFNEETDAYVTALYSEQCENKKLTMDFNSSGSGYMQILQILAPIYSVCPLKCKVVLLDEPDAHLHPNMQIALTKSLQKIQQELGIQIIISTHSPSIIKSSRPNDIVPVSSKNKICKPLSTQEEVVDSISLIDNFELAKSVISGKMVFFEDSDTSILEAADKLLCTRVFSGANTVSIHTGRSKDDKLPFNIKEVLKEFIGKDIEIIFVRDNDGINDEWRQKLISYAQSKNVTLIMPEKYEIENYVLNPSLIFRTLKKKHPDSLHIPDESIITQKIIEFLKNTIILSKFKYDDNLEVCRLKKMTYSSLWIYQIFLLISVAFLTRLSHMKHRT